MTHVISGSYEQPTRLGPARRRRLEAAEPTRPGRSALSRQEGLSSTGLVSKVDEKEVAAVERSGL
jgi:hypothetical protein